MPSKLLLDFSNYSDAKMYETGSKVETDMTDNTNFVTPIPSIADLTAATASYNLAWIASTSGDTTAIEIKNQRKGALADILGRLGMYVMLTADGDRAKLISSGFPVSKERQPRPPLDKPATPTVTNGINPGELDYRLKSMRGAISYLYQYTTTDPSLEGTTWETQGSSRSKFTVTNLTRGKRYWCRVGVTGPYNQLVYSDVVSWIVQ